MPAGTGVILDLLERLRLAEGPPSHQHGESTVRHALAATVREGKIGRQTFAPRGYALPAVAREGTAGRAPAVGREEDA